MGFEIVKIIVAYGGLNCHLIIDLIFLFQNPEVGIRLEY